MPSQTRKQKKRGGRYIASGTYGCGYRPAIRCKGEANRIQGAISKVMDRVHAEEEFAVYSLLQPVDPQQLFFLYPLRMCELGRLELPENSLVPCKAAKRNLTLLQYMDGGTNLHQFTLEARDAVPFFQDLVHLFGGLYILDQNGIVHGDVKLENAVVKRLPSGRFSFKFIDFGFTTHLDKLERTFGEDRLEKSSFNWPFDLRFLVRGYIYTEDERRSFESRIRRWLGLFPAIYSSGVNWELEVYNDFRSNPAKNKIKRGLDIYGLGLILSELKSRHFDKIRFAYRGRDAQIDAIGARMTALVEAMMTPYYKRRIEPLAAVQTYYQIVSLLNILVGEASDKVYSPVSLLPAPLPSVAEIAAAAATARIRKQEKNARKAEQRAAAIAAAQQREADRRQAAAEVERARDTELQAVALEISAQKEVALEQEKTVQGPLWNAVSKQKTNQYVRQFEGETFVNRTTRNARRNAYVAALKQNLEQSILPFRQRQAYIETQYNQHLQARQAEINQRWNQELERRLAELPPLPFV